MRNRARNAGRQATSGATELQRLWVPLLRDRWSSLAVVSAGQGASPRVVVAALTEVLPLLDAVHVRVVDATEVAPSEHGRIAAEIAAATRCGVRTVLALDSPVENPSRISLLPSIDAALLVVRLGGSELASLRSLVALLGPERTLGCVAVHGRARAEHELDPAKEPR